MKDFEKIIWRDALTLIDFFSSGCEPCHSMRPDIERFKQVMIGRVDVYHINIDAPEMEVFVNRYNIRELPTQIFFRRGEVLWRGKGTITCEQLIVTLTELEKQEVI